MTTPNYYDGNWRPVLDLSDRALATLRRRGFEMGADNDGRLMARWPVAPAAPLPLAGLAFDYWREEARLNSPALERLARICAARGCDYQATIERLREE